MNMDSNKLNKRLTAWLAKREPKMKGRGLVLSRTKESFMDYNYIKEGDQQDLRKPVKKVKKSLKRTCKK